MGDHDPYRRAKILTAFGEITTKLVFPVGKSIDELAQIVAKFFECGVTVVGTVQVKERTMHSTDCVFEDREEFPHLREYICRDGIRTPNGRIKYTVHSWCVTLNGEFSLGELEELASFMRKGHHQLT